MPDTLTEQDCFSYELETLTFKPSALMQFLLFGFLIQDPGIIVVLLQLERSYSKEATASFCRYFLSPAFADFENNFFFDQHSALSFL